MFNPNPKLQLTPPVYDGIEPVTIFQAKVNEWFKTINSKKYDMILDFINQWLEGNNCHHIGSLTEFKYIPKNKLLVDKDYDFDLIRLYSKHFTTLLGIDTKLEDKTPNSQIEHTYIISYISSLIKTIGYKFRILRRNGKTLFLIKKL